MASTVCGVEAQSEPPTRERLDAIHYPSPATNATYSRPVAASVFKAAPVLRRASTSMGLIMLDTPLRVHLPERAQARTAASP